MKMKRIVDIIGSLIALCVFLIPILLLILYISRRLGTPIFFKQIRPGLYNKPFQMVKFRTMTNQIGPDGQLLPDAERLTPFGSWMRSTSLDELPELWNVLKGDMSLVGPRPLLMEYLPIYSIHQARRHDVRPGITGWAQINGRNNISWTQKFDLDVWYVDHQSLVLDAKIILITIVKVLRKDDVVKFGHVTTDFFNGKN